MARRYTKKAKPKVYTPPGVRNAHYRLPIELDEEIVKLAANEGIAINSMATRLLAEGIKSYTARS